MAFLTNNICTTNKPISILSGSGIVSLSGNAVSVVVAGYGFINATISSTLYDGLSAVNIGTTVLAGPLTIGNNSPSTSVIINAGTNGISIGANASAKPITIGNTTGNTSLTLNSGTGAINIGTSIAKTITIGNTTGNTKVDINSGSGGINIGNTATGKTITIGSTNNASTIETILIGTNASGGGTVNTTIGSTTGGINNINIIASNAAISVVNSMSGTNSRISLSSNSTITIGANPVAQTITIGNTTGATALVFNTGSGGTTFNSGIRTNPVNSSVATPAFTSSLTLGTSVRNTTGYNLLCNICVDVTSATTATITLGVGSATAPSNNTVVSSFSTVDPIQKIFSAIVPNNYYLEVNTVGTIVVSSINIQSCPL